MTILESNALPLIFVSVAAYRDPQLVPTVLDCLAKAEHPQRLRFGICWQHGPEETVLPFADDPRFRILDVDWRDSRGACWARAECMSLFRDEAWFLQVDSHCRFVERWDAKLIETAGSTGSAKPILSTYATPFTPGENEVLTGGPLQIAFQAFTPEGIPQLKPVGLTPAELVGDLRFRARRARFASAGFLFAQGSFVHEIPYDPELYFMGEEISMTVRAFTHGYDIFHPSETILWHDYLRADSRKHWGDHVETNDVAKPWSELDIASKEKVQQLLRGKAIAPFGLGTVRSLEEYERYAGLSFALRKAQHHTMKAAEPPNPEAPPDWADHIYPWIAKIRLQRSQLPAHALEDPGFWYLGINDAEGGEIVRIDMTPEALAPVLESDSEELALVVEFPSEVVPHSWMVWPLSKSRGWLQSVRGLLAEDDYAILKEEDAIPAD